MGEHVVMTTYLIGSVICGAGLSLSYGWQLTLVGLAIVPLAVAVATTVSKVSLLFNTLLWEYIFLFLTYYEAHCSLSSMDGSCHICL